MEFYIGVGPDYQKIYKALIETNQDTSALEAKYVEFPSDGLFYWSCYWDLHSTRQYTMGGVGPIPWTALNDWSDRYNVNGMEFELLSQMIQELDAVYVSKMNKKGE